MQNISTTCSFSLAAFLANSEAQNWALSCELKQVYFEPTLSVRDACLTSSWSRSARVWDSRSLKARFSSCTEASASVMLDTVNREMKGLDL